MKSAFHFFLTVMIMAVAARTMAQQSQPSLGDYARGVKKAPKAEKRPAQVYDNDNLPKDSSLSVVGAAGDKNQNADADAQAQDGDKSVDGKAADNNSEAEKTPELKAGQPIEERQKALAAWKDKLDDQKKEIDLMSRELEVLQREHDIKAHEFYSNTAMRAQNSTAFAATDEKYKQKIQDKQAALDAAKTKLESMQDQARKAGAPSSVTE